MICSVASASFSFWSANLQHMGDRKTNATALLYLLYNLNNNGGINVNHDC